MMALALDRCVSDIHDGIEADTLNDKVSFISKTGHFL